MEIVAKGIAESVDSISRHQAHKHEPESVAISNGWLAVIAAVLPHRRQVRLVLMAVVALMVWVFDFLETHTGLNNANGVDHYKNELIRGLQDKSTEENRRLPMRLDDATRLERVDVEGLDYIYVLTLTQPQVVQAFRRSVLNGQLHQRHERAKVDVCENLGLATLMQEGVRLVYRYSSDAGDPLMSITLSDSDCL